MRLIVSSDNGDRDDAKAFALLNYELDHGADVQLLAVMADKRSTFNAGDLDSYLYYFGRSGTVPVGKNKTGVIATDGYTSGNLCPRNVIRVGDASDATTLYRQLLAAAPDNSVRLLNIGWLDNLNNLLTSAADGIDARNGAALVAAKVERLYVMGGVYPGGGASTENNFKNSPADTQNVLANWPTEIRFIGKEVGDAISNAQANFTSLPGDSPIRAKIMAAGADNEWDSTAMMAALYSDASGATSWFTWVQGTNSYNSATLTQTWTTGAGNHYYAVPAQTAATFQSWLLTRESYTKTQATFDPQRPLDRWRFNGNLTSKNGLTATAGGVGSVSSGSYLSCQHSAAGYASIAVSDVFRFFPRRSRTYVAGIRTKTFSGVEEALFGGDRDGGCGWWRPSITSTRGWLVTWNGGSDIAGPSSAVADNTVYHVVIVNDGVAGTATLYVNGSQVGSTYSTAGDQPGACAGTWYFGGAAGASDSGRFAGIDMDYFGVFEGAASAAQVAAMASAYTFGTDPTEAAASAPRHRHLGTSSLRIGL